MTSQAKTPAQYMAELPENRKEPMERLRAAIKKNLDPHFKEIMIYGMLGYVVPLDIYPAGYRDPKTPLSFINLASQKNHIAYYHLGIYADEEVHSWFLTEYAKRVGGKLDMGKSCIRFRNVKKIPYELMGELAGKIALERWIELYENAGSSSSSC